MRGSKVTILLCSIMAILCLGACGKYPASDTNLEILEAPKVSDYVETSESSEVDSFAHSELSASLQEINRGLIINVKDYIAYITEDKRVYCITEQDSGYLPELTNAKRLYADTEYLIILLENGTFQIYHPRQKQFLSLEEVKESLDEVYNSGSNGGMDEVENKLLLLEAENIVDAYISSFSFVAIKKAGSDTWEFGFNSIAEGDFDKAKDAVSFATNLSYAWPAYILCEDGAVLTLAWCAPGIYEEKKIAQWTGIQDLAYGTILFGRWPDGTVDAPRRSYGEASEMKDWQNIVQISADPFVTAALTADGCVLVDCFQKEDTLKVAEEWTDIIYLSVFTEYILGVKADGSFCVTPTGSWYDTVFEEPEHPKSMVKTGE